MSGDYRTLTRSDAERIVDEATAQGWEYTHLHRWTDEHGVTHYAVEAAFGQYAATHRFYFRDREEWFRLKQKVEELRFIAEEAARLGLIPRYIDKHGDSLVLHVSAPWVDGGVHGYFGDTIDQRVGGLRTWRKLTRRNAIEGMAVIDPPALEARRVE